MQRTIPSVIFLPGFSKMYSPQYLHVPMQPIPITMQLKKIVRINPMNSVRFRRQAKEFGSRLPLVSTPFLYSAPLFSNQWVRLRRACNPWERKKSKTKREKSQGRHVYSEESGTRSIFSIHLSLFTQMLGYALANMELSMYSNRQNSKTALSFQTSATTCGAVQ